MLVDGLPVPPRLLALMDRGLWPRTSAEELKQNLKSLVPKERVQSFAPEEDRIYLIKPPFDTVAKARSARESKFWSSHGALEGIAPDLCVIIADFGLGSDSPVLLDYRQDRFNPAVIRLQWRKPQPNVWVCCANDFNEFADKLGLDDVRK